LVVSAIPALRSAVSAPAQQSATSPQSATAPKSATAPAATTTTKAATAHSTNTKTLVLAFHGKPANPAAAAVAAVRKAAGSLAGAKVVSAKALRPDAASVTLNKSLTRDQANRLAAVVTKASGVRYAEASVTFYPTDAGGSDKTDYYWNLDQINAAAAWSIAPNKGKGVVVGVIDTGIADNPLLPKALLVSPTNGVVVSGTTWPGLPVTLSYTAASGPVTIPNPISADTAGNWATTLNPAAVDKTEVTVTATDLSGNTTTTKVTVDGSTTLTVNPSNGTTISGTAEGGDTVALTYPDKTTQTTTADKGGDWSVTPTATLTNGDVVTVKSTDSLGNTITKTVTIDTVKPQTPTVKASNGTTISGTSEAGATITVTLAGATLCTTVVGSNGEYSCQPKPTPDNKAKVSVTATDPSGNVSDATEVTIDQDPPSAPEVSATNGKSFRGTAEAGSTVRLTYPDGTSHEVVAGGTTHWSFTDPNTTLNDGDLVSVTATDAAGNTSPATVVTVDRTPPDAPTVNPSDGQVVSGTAEPGTTVVITYTSGHTAYSDEADVADDGTWTATLTHLANDKSTLQVHARDAAGNNSSTTTRRVHYGPPSSPTVAPSNGKTVQISGVETDTTPSLLDANGVAVAGDWADQDAGAWEFTPTTALTESDSVTVIVTDSDGVTSTPVPVTIDTTAPDAPVISAATTTNIYGTAEAGTTIKVGYTDADGSDHSPTAVADTNGDWTIDLDTPAVGGSSVTATATDAAGNTSDEATATVEEPSPPPSESPSPEATPESVTKSQGTSANSSTTGDAGSAELGASTGTGTVLPGYDFVGKDSNASDDGDTWHGTHVAGIVAATGYMKPSGVAPGVKILPIRALGDSGTLPDVADAISWGAGVDFFAKDGSTKASPYPVNPYPADVLNLSLGATGTACPSYLQSAITAAINRGTSIVVSAGNDNQSIANSTPANCTGVIVVTATTNGGSRASYSNWGTDQTSNALVIAAPGGSGDSTDCTPPGYACTGFVVSTINGAIGGKIGTSMAAPHVAGVAALLKSLNKSLTPAQIASYIRGTATTLSDGCPTGVCGSGIVDAAAALDAFKKSQPVTISDAKYGAPVTIAADPVSRQMVGKSISVSAISGYPALSYSWFRRTGGKDTPVGNGATYEVTGADYGSTLRACAYPTGGGTDVYCTSGGAGVYSNWSNWTEVTKAPLGFSKKPSASGTTKVGKTLTAKYAYVPSPASATVKYQWYRNGKAISKATKVTYKITKTDRGKAISVKVSINAWGYYGISAPSKRSNKIKR
jgi:hypothetical protein